jgi:hypothetical protein
VTGLRALRALTLASTALMVFLMGVSPAVNVSGSITPEPLPSGAIVTPQKYRRAPEQTWLTFPEWSLVFSPREYASYVARRTPTGFPFLGHLEQFWGGYARTWQASRNYPFNFDYHLMDVIIGTSTTFEYVLTAAYEETVGRLSGGEPSDEDRYAARVAADYAGFIDFHAWYEFDFKGKLQGLWSTVPALGTDLLRKWERRYFLTTEYGFKAIYGWLLGGGTRASYAPEPEVTAVLVDHVVPLGYLFPGMLTVGDNLVTVPRYQAFMAYAMVMAQRGMNFREIAGNSGFILVTGLMPVSQPLTDEWGHILFTQPLITQPSVKRVAVDVPVPKLSQLLLDWQRHGIQPEHIFDY